MSNLSARGAVLFHFVVEYNGSKLRTGGEVWYLRQPCFFIRIRLRFAPTVISETVVDACRTGATRPIWCRSFFGGDSPQFSGENPKIHIGVWNADVPQRNSTMHQKFEINPLYSDYTPWRRLLFWLYTQPRSVFPKGRSLRPAIYE